jgi:serine/threonine protein kinase
LALEKFLNYPDNKKTVFMIVKERDIHRKLNHEIVVKVEEFIKIYDDVSEFPRSIFICLFMELCDGVLSHLIRTSPENRLSEDKAREWFKQISKGLRYLHEQNIVHLDLKPNNILFKRNSCGSFIYKLSDFGLSLKWKSGFPKRFNVAVGVMR